MLFKVKVQLKTVGAFICSKDFYISPPPPPQVGYGQNYT